MHPGPISIMFVVFGFVLVVVYFLFEPAPVDPARPFTILAHGLWEALAVRSLWPGVGMMALGSIGITRWLYLRLIRA